MHVMLVVTRGDTLGGAQVHVRDLARGLIRDGMGVHVVTGSTGIFTDDLTVDGIPVSVCSGLLREIHPIRDRQAVRELVDLIRGVRPDIVATHSSKAGVIGRIAARIAGVPAVFTAHGWVFNAGIPQPSRSLYLLIELIHAPLAKRIICVSHHDRAIAERAGIRANRLRVIHNGIADDVPAHMARPAEACDAPRAVMTARFLFPKDHATLIEAVARVPALRLDLIGDGPDRPAAEQLVASRRLGERVKFLGERTDIAAQLAAAHLFVLSSRKEGFPYATLEAMRAGLPVVVSNVGGAAEAVTEGETGFVVPPGDVDALAERLGQLAKNPAARAAMGAGGRRRYEAEFTFDQMYAATAAVWAEAAAR